ncbi:MAG: hypothetical protein RL653_2311 [Pseudomonadota bacterium]|jgi:hypothetical protein
MRLLRSSGLLLLAATAAHANSTGRGHQDCNGCHVGGETPAVGIRSSAVTVAPGALVQVVVEVASVGNQSRAGFSLRSGGGLLSAAEPGVRMVGGDATHLQPKGATNGVSRFTVQWAAPMLPGTYALAAWGNAVDGLSGSSGDGAALTTTSITVAGEQARLDAGFPEEGGPDGGTGGKPRPQGSGGMSFGTAPPPPEPERGCAAAGASLAPVALLAGALSLRRRRR